MFNNVLVGVDGREGGRRAMTLAKQLIVPHGQITPAHVYGKDPVVRSGAAPVSADGRGKSDRLREPQRAASELEAELITCSSSRTPLAPDHWKASPR
jgi:hypothetical protein